MLNFAELQFTWLNYMTTFFFFEIMNIQRKHKKRFEICSKLTIKTAERHIDIILVSLLLTLNILHTFFLGFYCSLRTGKFLLWNQPKSLIPNKKMLRVYINGTSIMSEIFTTSLIIKYLEIMKPFHLGTLVKN